MDNARNISYNHTAEISALRKMGKLDVAYRLASADYQATPNDPWTQMSMFYVLRDMCKNAIAVGNMDDAKEKLEVMVKLSPTMKDDNKIAPKICNALRRQLLPEANIINEASVKSKVDAVGAYATVKNLISESGKVDVSLHTSLGWILYRYIHANIDTMSSKELRTLLSYYIKLEVERPSVLHSQMLLMAINVSMKHSDFNIVAFFRLWNPCYFRDEDIQKGKGNDGKEYSSLAVKAIKRCFQWVKGQQHKDSEQVAWLASLYDTVIGHNSADDWLLRDRASIYLWQDDRNKALNIYMELVLRLSEKYYIWSELADLINDNDDLRIALLSKALLLERNEIYLGGIHLRLAAELIKKGMKAEALRELMTYEQVHHNPSQKYANLRRAIGDDVSPTTDNKDMYTKNAVAAEGYAFANVEPVNVAVVQRYKDHDKRHFTVLTNGANVRLKVNDKVFPVVKRADMGKVFSARVYNGKILSLYPSNDDASLPNFKDAIAAVTNVNYEKGFFFYTLGEGHDSNAGKVGFNETPLRPEPGQCIKVRYCTSTGKDGRQILLTARIELTDEVNDNAVRRVSGRLKVKFRHGNTGIQPDYAFIDHYYVHRSLLRKHDIFDDCNVTADVVYAGDGKWTAVNLIL